MASNAILVLTRPIAALQKCVGSILTSSIQSVHHTLYVHINPEADFSNPHKQKVIAPTITMQKFLLHLYAGAANMCSTLDIRVLLGNIHSPPDVQISPQTLSRPVDLVIHDGLKDQFTDKDILEYLSRQFNLKPELPVTLLYESQNIQDDCQKMTKTEEKKEETLLSYNHVCLGGTFDRIHTGHKIFLTEACIRCNRKLTIGVTDLPMIQNKTLCELIEPTSKRIVEVATFVGDIRPSISCETVPITDPYGPSIVYPDIECLVVSQETLRGGQSVNRKRVEKGLDETELYVVELVEDECRATGEEEKISSSSQRRRNLGTLLKPPQDLGNNPQMPYLVGLTGGIASGKSSIREKLEALGAGTIDCDKMGHLAYEPGTPAYNDILAAFSDVILDSNGKIDRGKLGSQVFGNEEKRQILNVIVWPAVEKLAWDEIHKQHQQGKQVVVLEAALLLDAGWASKLNEVWVTVVPKQEALRRVMERNNLTEEEAAYRIEAQPSNVSRVEQAHVVLSTLWTPEETLALVSKAWKLLQQRIPDSDLKAATPANRYT